MDVTCQRCGTEYEFDETLVSERGTTVKCTHCGHLFKVYRPGSRPADPAAQRRWQVRGADGKTESLRSLRDLQERIAKGQLTQNDQITRTGDNWKRLGEIAELKSFFAAASAADEGRKRVDTSGGLGQLPARGALSQTFEGIAPSADLEPSFDELPTTTPESRAETAKKAPPPKAAPRKRRPPRSGDTEPPPLKQAAPRAPSLSEHEPQAHAEEQRAPALSQPDLPMPEAAKRAPRLTDDPPAPASAPPSAPQAATSQDASEVSSVSLSSISGARTTPWGKYALYVILVSAAGYVGLTWDTHIAPLLESPPSEEGPDLTEAEDAFNRGDASGYEQAVGEFDRVSRRWPDDIRGYIGLSRAHARLAHALASADEEEAQGSRDARRALSFAEEALRIEASNVDARIAEADALRLLGRVDEARDKLTSLSDISGSADLERLRGLLADETAAISHFQRAVELEADDLGLQVQLLTALLAGGRSAEARPIYDRLIGQAAYLREAIAYDGGLPEAGTSGAESPSVAANTAEPPTRAGTEAREADSRATPENAPEGPRDYSWYISRGEELQERGNLAGARESFQRALSLRPGSSEALTGMGYLALSSGNYAEAARRFEPAARSGYAAAYIGLGQAYRSMGRYREALRAYERYLERRGSGGDASIARRQVEALRQMLGDEDPAAPAPQVPTPPTEPPTSEAPPPPTPAPPAPAEPAPVEPEREEPEPEAPAPAPVGNDLPSATPPPPSPAPTAPAQEPPVEGL